MTCKLTLLHTLDCVSISSNNRTQVHASHVPDSYDARKLLRHRCSRFLSYFGHSSLVARKKSKNRNILKQYSMGLIQFLTSLRDYIPNDIRQLNVNSNLITVNINLNLRFSRKIAKKFEWLTDTNLAPLVTLCYW